MPLILRLSLDEYWPEFSARGDVLDHRFVDRFLVVKKERKYRVHQLGRNSAADLVALHDYSPQGMGYAERLVQRFFWKLIPEFSEAEQEADSPELLNSCTWRGVARNAHGTLLKTTYNGHDGAWPSKLNGWE